MGKYLYDSEDRIKQNTKEENIKEMINKFAFIKSTCLCLIKDSINKVKIKEFQEGIKKLLYTSKKTGEEHKQAIHSKHKNKRCSTSLVTILNNIK